MTNGRRSCAAPRRTFGRMGRGCPSTRAADGRSARSRAVARRARPATVATTRSSGPCPIHRLHSKANASAPATIRTKSRSGRSPSTPVARTSRCAEYSVRVMPPATATGRRSRATTRTRLSRRAAPSTAMAEPSVCARSTGVYDCGAGSARYHHELGCESPANASVAPAAPSWVVTWASPPSGYRTISDTTRAANARAAPAPSSHHPTRRDVRSSRPIASPAHR
jgi:hypothetical protein